ncbi:MAG: prepilin-type N-terminal cleavage/methylation domain-containing protein [Candidatus Levyibacteriota bacterium]
MSKKKNSGFTLYLRRRQGFTLYPLRRQAKSGGFTLIEIVVVAAVVLTLLSFASINLFNLPSTSSLDSIVATLTTDIKTQQIKAMVGDTEGRGVPDTYGIYFTPSSYTLFHGATYSSSSPDNFVSSLPSGYGITTILPSSTLVFNKGSGEIAGFSSTQNSITVTDTKTGKQKIISLNKYGTITGIQ